MIEGITVLAETTSAIPWWQALLMALISAIIAGVLFGLLDNSVPEGIIVGAISIIAVFLLVGIANREASPTYKVLIDESVSLKDFDELYEIVGHDGDIVLIKMKENIKE